MSADEGITDNAEGMSSLSEKLRRGPAGRTEGILRRGCRDHGGAGSPSYVGRTVYFRKRRIRGGVFFRLFSGMCVLSESDDFQEDRAVR